MWTVDLSSSNVRVSILVSNPRLFLELMNTSTAIEMEEISGGLYLPLRTGIDKSSHQSVMYLDRSNSRTKINMEKSQEDAFDV